MDILLVVIAFAVWVVSAVNKEAKKVRQRQQSMQPPATPGEGQRERTEIRPADIDLSGQTSMPIHWDGTSSEGHSTEGPRPTRRTEERPKEELDEILRAWGIPREAADDPSWETTQEKPQKGPVTIPGLSLQLNQTTLVSGVILSEILTRRPPIRRPK